MRLDLLRYSALGVAALLACVLGCGSETSSGQSGGSSGNHGARAPTSGGSSNPAAGSSGAAGRTGAGGAAGGGGASMGGGAGAGAGSAGASGASAVGGTTGAGGGDGGSFSGGLGGGAGSAGEGGPAGALGMSGESGAAGGDGGNFWRWDFVDDTEGWLGEFADYPPELDADYDLLFEWSSLPAEVGPGGGLKTNGNNHSDDLFTYLKRHVTGLSPDTSYLVDVEVVIDTNASAECGGIGGSPGKSLTFKIGATTQEPTASLDSMGFLRMELDKGNQSTGGTDMKVVGDIANSLPCVSDPPYEPKTLSLQSFAVKTDSSGGFWVVLGTDSGFEGITTLYYDHVTVELH